VLLLVMFGGPFVKIQGNPLLMINIVERRFSVLGVIFWPQDNLIFALGFLLFLTGIAIFTAAFGRLWCGWTCPQTVLMEMVFRKIEYAIEGDASAQKALDRAPLSGMKILKKGSKHLIFAFLSFIIGNVLLAYIIGWDSLKHIITVDPRHHATGLGFMFLFSLGFYGIFARFREQACTFICPYGRFQSTLLDENSIVVAYDHKRGEQRGRARRQEHWDHRRTHGMGDCIDCFRCVTVCPTGIDIRNGTQMECVACTACIDACDEVMDKMKHPRGLIRYASLNGIEKGEQLRVTPRLIVYCGLLMILGLALTVLLLTRSDMDASFLRSPGSLFQEAAEGRISNIYELKLTNKTHSSKRVELKLEGIEGVISILGDDLVVPAEQQVEVPVIVEIAPVKLQSGSTPFQVGIYVDGKLGQLVKTGFIGPRK
jgi:cytochrome c oxidase accessory protein FixG